MCTNAIGVSAKEEDYRHYGTSENLWNWRHKNTSEDQCDMELKPERDCSIESLDSGIQSAPQSVSAIENTWLLSESLHSE